MNNQDHTPFFDDLLEDLINNIRREITETVKIKDSHLGFIVVNVPEEKLKNLISRDKNDLAIKMRIFPVNEIIDKSIFCVNQKQQKPDKDIYKKLFKEIRFFENFFVFEKLTNCSKIKRFNFIDFYGINIKNAYIKDNSTVYFRLNNSKNGNYYFKFEKTNNNILLSKNLCSKIKKQEKDDKQRQIVNLADFVLFDPETVDNGLVFMPISFFTTPTLVYVTKNFYIDSQKIKKLLDDKDKFISLFNSLKRKLQTYINYYIYQRLLRNATHLTNTTSERYFIRNFVTEIAELLLPIKYTYKYRNDQKRMVFMFKTWSANKGQCSGERFEKVTLSLKALKKNKNGVEIEEKIEEVTFYLKSYKVPRMGGGPQWLHKTDEYKKIKDINIKLLESLFTLLYTQWDNKQVIEKSSMKSALSAVMSRNMSHNIGSHVLNKLSDKKNILRLIQEGKDLFLNSQFQETIAWLKNKTQDEDAAELISIFNEYLNNRMFFIADVASADRAFNYTKKRMFSDTLTYFKKNRLLLEYISGKGSNFEYTLTCKYNNKEFKGNISDDLYVALPNDVLGEQALFIILENIIRNTAKHSGNVGKVVNFIIDVDGKSLKEFYIVKIYDDIDHNDLDKLIVDRNLDIYRSVLTKNKEIRSKGWGTIEMKLAAAYLSRIKSSEIDKYEYAPVINLEKLPNLRNILTNPKNKGQKFFENLLRKQKGYKEVLVDGNDNFVSEKGTNSFIKNNGINKKISYRDSGYRDNFPILQAIKAPDGKGFGYVFLMKKPRTIMIWDKTKSLLNTLDHNTIQELNSKGIYIFNEPNEKNPYFFDSILLYYGKQNISENDIHTIHKNKKWPQNVYSFSNGCFAYHPYKTINKDKTYCVIPNLDIQNIIEFVEEYLKLSYLKALETVYNINIAGQKCNQIPTAININTKETYINIHDLSENAFNSTDYVEITGSSTRLGKYISGEFSFDKFFFLQKAIQTKVVIIDERIQEFLNENTNYKIIPEEEETSNKFISYKDVFEKKGIIVPPIEEKDGFDLNHTDIFSNKEKILNFIGEKTKDAQYLVMHYGIIEKLKDKDKDYLSSIVKVIKDKMGVNCKLVINSGRAITPEIQSLREYYLGYNSIKFNVVDTYGASKAHLISLLESLRIS